MKIRRLQLNPFAGTTQRDILFTNGLNVILGPNEAGKSTLLQALRCLFFVPTGLTAHQFGKQMKAYLPLSGGDTLRVEGDIELGGEQLNLSKSWGGTKGARLVLPSGTDLTEAARVEEEIAKRLGFSQAVYDQVLLTRQNQLKETIDLLRKEPESTLSLSDKLRQSLYELDGISVHALKQDADKEVKAYFSHWDSDTNKPEKGKDIHNPWLKEVGYILKAYYDWKAKESSLEEVIAHENALDTLNRQLMALEGSLGELLAFVYQYEPVVNDLQKRRELGLKGENLLREKTELTAIAEKWPIQQNKLEESLRLKEEKEKQLATTQEYLKLLRDYNKRQEDIKLYEKVKELVEQFKQLQEQRAVMPRATAQDITELRKAEREWDRLRSMLEAQKLRIAIKPRNPVQLKIVRGIHPQEELNLQDELYQQEAGGRVQIDHADFTIAIVSGEKDVRQLILDIQGSEEKFNKLLARWEATGIEEVEKLKTAFEQKQFEEDQLKRQIESLLKGRRFADLEQSVSEIVKPAVEETLEVLEARVLNLTAALSEHKTTLSNAQSQVRDWEARYGSRQKLFDMLVANTAALAALEKEQAQLQPIPAEVQDLESFIRDFQQKKQAAEQGKDRRNELEKERLRLEAHAPDTSSEEMQEQLKLAQMHFDKTLRTGRAYLRVQRELDSILEELDKDTFTPLKEKTEYYFHRLTGGKYQKLLMEELVPAAVQINGAALPAELLSAGTLDLLALATRLAMADFYLPEQDGFIILDDPLVNLDPERQQMAAQCLRDIAQHRQVIVLTCHPRHADMLEGDVIELGG